LHQLLYKIEKSGRREGCAMTMVLVKENKNFVAMKEKPSSGNEEVTAFCPKCKALQTVWLNGDMLLPTRKYTQVGKNVYHNCGSKQPCRLY
jgi:hypothetical protein